MMTENKTIPTTYLSEAQLWQAVVTRDKKADTHFVYGVRTTGIYCRPSCASRQPKPDNVQYFATPLIAQAGGYRACKRCKPEQFLAVHKHYKRVLAACRNIENSDRKTTLKILAEQANMSPYHFQRVFKQLVGLSPKQYEKACREINLRKSLTTSKSVTEAIYAAGFQSSGHFYANANEMSGMSPRNRQKKGCGESLRFAVGQCSLGSILVAASERGVCTISLGDNPEKLIEDFQRDFAKADLNPNDKSFNQLVANVVGLIENPQQSCDLPLDVRGTAFQKQVWQVLSTIQPGQTLTYTEVAQLINKPRAVRAVASACGANRLAVAIPCHRVIGRNGALSGYRWGIERKQMLLDKEKATTPTAVQNTD